jgi:2'-hydroxyisoflavone reductase
LKENADYYICVSSISVYYPYNNKTLKEGDDLVLEIPKGISENEEYLYDYGVMKANSELEAINVFGEERTAVVRPTFMMGPTDRTNRFLYYPLGLKKGGDILVPGKWNDRVQYMDVRDIAEWMIRLSESKTVGVFNGSGPASPGFISSFVYGCHAAFSSKVNYTYLDDYGFLKRNNMRFQAPWVLEEGKFNGMLGALNDKAVENG